MSQQSPLSKQQIERMKKIGKRVGYIVLSIVLLIMLVLFTYRFLTEYIWMDSIGFKSIFTTVLLNKVFLGISGFLLFGISGFFMMYWILRSYLSHFHSTQLPSFLLERKKMMWIIVGIAFLFGLFGSTITQGIGWERLLKFLNYESFGKADPYFDIDISFYLFSLPFIKFVINVLLGLSIFYFLVTVASYSVFNMYRMNRSAQVHMGVMLAAVGLLLAGQHVLAPYETLFTNSVNIFQNSVVHGLSFTDEFFNIPAAYVLAVAAVIGAIWMIVAVVRGRLQTVIAVPIVYIGLVIVGQLGSVVVQNFMVSPNEFTRESPYLEHNRDYTRAAYDLSDIDEKEHPGEESLDADMVERNRDTIDNIRINDVSPLLEVYNSRDTLRTYYNFHDVDVDRYEIDGEYEQVFIGARELNTDDLPETAQTWVNQYLRYTHGYGAVMSHVNEVTAQGQPEYLLKDIPPEGEIEVDKPQVYFGEGDFNNVIGNSEYDEFDYPESGESASTSFDANTGIPMTKLNRVLFTIREKSFRLLVSDQITEESQYLETRNIVDRVNRIAPFFEYDDDPYLFIRDDGSLAWMLDAYLAAERYPYSESHTGNENYIRNSVKVVISAYSGEVDYYTVDDEDPVLQTYVNMFPELFSHDIPEDVEEHFRYPTKLFTVQADMYGTYHMENLEIFYNREDYWEFPTEKYHDKDITMEPYYITMELPEEDKDEFILMVPYTPKKRQNMIAWIGVRNDGDKYGEMFVHRFPKQQNIYGPQQIENRINQDSRISQELNLWSQGGSEVIRGNLLTIPIEDTVFYVEPIYIQSSNETSLPEVKQIVIAYGQHIVMKPTFDEALDEILDLIEEEGVDFGEIDDDSVDPDDPDAEAGDPTEDEPAEDDPVEDEPAEDDPADDDPVEDEPDTDEPTIPFEDADELLEEVSDLFDDYQEAMGAGEWEEAGKIMTEIEEMLGSLQQ